MDAKRFDAFAKALISETNRRQTLGGLLGGALGALGLAGADDADAAKSGKCKEECALCEFCKKGTCRKTRSGKKRCRKGKCKPERNGTPCASSGGACQNGTCLCPDGRANCGANCCVDNQICQNGTCTCPDGTELCGGVNGVCVPPCNANQARNLDTCTCCSVNTISCTVGPDCCSNVCAGTCATGGTGTPCNVGGNCASGVCTNGRCAAP